METFARIWTILGLIALSRAGDSSVDILAPNNLDSFEDDVLHALSRNKTDTTKNFTFVDMISSLGNYSIDAERKIWSDIRPDTYRTNPYYGESILRCSARSFVGTNLASEMS
jgi:hypothetical protein